MPGKHILFISSWYPNRNDPAHGIFNRSFAEAVALYNKVSVLHVCSEEDLATDYEITEAAEEKLRTTIVYYRKVTSEIPFLAQLKKRRMLLRAFDRGFGEITKSSGMPDLIQLNVVMPNGIGALHLAKKHGIPYVINECWTGYMPEDGSYKGFLQKYFTRKIVASAKMILPVSADMKRAMLGHGLTGNYRIIPNVVNCERFVPVQTNERPGHVFLHVSSLDDAQKNVSGIIRAFAELRKRAADCHLRIVGEGKDGGALQKLARALTISDHVHFTGRKEGQDLVEEINGCDALVMFSNYESFSLVVAEAFACGKPVIVSDAGGLSSELPPGLGILVKKRDEKGLSEAMYRFTGQKQHFDAAKIRAFAVNNFSIEKVGRQFDEVFMQVLATIRKPGR